ncbi:MAG: SDR family NAD(P)-dependent oxidoreductase [Methylococcaceae bacterium]|nr:SDR family NAD(P)-dependent oxidoreductase [Methylococcaceae bacterium]
MKSHQARSAVVVGVGPSRGLGATLARRFAREGLHVFIVGRTAENLERVVGKIRSAGGQATAVTADATVESDVVLLFDLATQFHDLEVVACNVDRNASAPLLETDRELFEQLWRQNCLAGFLVDREAVKHLLPRQQGSLFFTGATASLRARPPFTGFAAAKAGLRALAQGMDREFGPQGIHVAQIIIDGVIDGDRARAFRPVRQQQREDGLLQLDAIAETYWQLHCQHLSAWTHELDPRPYQEPF